MIAMSRRSGIASVSVIAILALGMFGLAELALPRLIENRLEQVVAGWFDSPGTVSVMARSMPSISMLAGRFDELSIHVAGARTGALRITEFRLDARSVNYPVLGNVDADLKYALGDSELYLSISETDLNAYIASVENVPGRVSMTLLDGKARVSTRAAVLGMDVDATADGKFVLRGRRSIAFVPDTLSVQGRALPDFVMQALKDRLAVVMTLPEITVELEMSQVRVTRGMLHLHGITRKR